MRDYIHRHPSCFLYAAVLTLLLCACSSRPSTAAAALAADFSDIETASASTVAQSADSANETASQENSDYLFDLCQAVEHCQNSVLLYDISEDELNELLNELRTIPDYFWLDGTIRYSIAGPVTTVNFTWKYDSIAERRAELNGVVAQILSGISSDASDYDKARYLHDWLCRNITYHALPNGYDQDIYAALVGNQCVCAGYSSSYTYLLNQLGIESYVITGTARGDSHSWNRVILDGDTYYSDLTWDDHDDGYDYYYWFNLTSAQIALTHTPDDASAQPESTASAYNYYIRNGLYLDAFDLNKLESIFAAQSGSRLVVSCADENIYSDLMRLMEDGNEFYQLLSDSGHPSSGLQYDYSDGCYVTTFDLS